jgi:branched-chain amino acid transport system ATP-binding protein
MLEIENIHAGYGRFTVLRGVSTRIASGDFRLVIGPNGAGKTTLMRTLFGLLKPSSGRVRFDGKDITDLPPRALLDLGVSYVPQQPSIFPQLTVRDNLEMGLYQSSRPDRNVINTMLERFELLGRRSDTPARAISGGERRLLELARALMIRPRLLMLDEPSLGLSPVMMNKVLSEVAAINAAGVTVVLIEQRVMAAAAMAKSISVIRLGAIVQEGSAAQASDSKWLAEAIYGSTEVAA